MDPHNGDADEYGVLPARRHGVDPLAPDLPPPGTAPLRMARLVSGEHLVTVNPLDGSEIEMCPPGEHPPAPVRLGPAARAEAARLAAPEPPPGAVAAQPLPLRRDAERARVLEALQQGRSVRLTGPSGSGRTSFLEMVAADCDSLAPDGVVRLNGFRRGADELLRDLASAVHDLELHRPDEGPLRELVATVAAVVVLDDLEFGGSDLDELLDAVPESVFLLAAAVDAPGAGPGARLTEMSLRGLDRPGGQALLERTAGRALDESESVWAGDLWFESEGLSLRFVQAGALLRLYDLLNEAAEAGTLQPGPEQQEAGAASRPEVFPVLAPTLAEGVAPVAGLVAGVSESARAALRFAVALDGEMPHASHLPALVGDTHADAALAELLDAALLSRVGSRHRLAAGVRTQLAQAGYAEPAQAERAAEVAAHHYAWWAAHPSVAPRRVAAESGAVLAALAAVVPRQDAVRAPADGEGAEQHVAVRLARTVAPVFAAALEWGAWERSLRLGQQAARAVGAVADEAYFRHELGILALCAGRPDRARAELQGALDLRGALADKRGTVAARRALALVADKDGTASSTSPLPAVTGELSRRGLVRASGAGAAAVDQPTVLGPSGRGTGRSGKRAPRRNLVAVGAGTLLVAVLGVVVTLGATSSGQDGKQGTDGGAGASEQPADPSFPDNTDLTDTPSAPESSKSSKSPSPSASSSPAASSSEPPEESPSESQSSSAKPTPSTSKPSTPTSRPPKPTPTPTPTKPTPTPTPTESDPGTGEPEPSNGSGSGTMSAPASTPVATADSTTSASETDGTPIA